MGPKPRRQGERLLRGEEVVQKDIVHFLWDVGPSEGREARLGTPVGEPLGRPKALGGGGHQKGGSVFVLGALIALKYPPLEVPATSHMCGVSCFQADLAAISYSRRRRVSVRW